MEITPVKPTIKLDVLEKIDILVGTIMAVEDVPRSEKLVKLTVETPVLATLERPVPNGARAG
jgi:tRNA-binding EMAP/Myf-like protein